MRIYAIILNVFLGIVSCYAQIYNYLSNSGGSDYIYFQNDDLKITHMPKNDVNTLFQFAMSDNLGRLIFYGNRSQIRNPSQEVIENGDNYAIDSNSGVCVALFPYDEDQYYLIHMGARNNREDIYLYYNKLDMKANDGKGKIIEKNNVFHFFNGQYYSFTFCRNTFNSYWILAYNTTMLYTFLANQNGITLKDSFQYDTYFNYPDTFMTLGSLPGNNISYLAYAQFSNQGDYLIMSRRTRVTRNPTFQNLWGIHFYTQNDFLKFNFNKTTGSFSFDQPIHQKSFVGEELEIISNFAGISCFASPNDSVIYSVIDYPDGNNGNRMRILNASTNQPYIVNNRLIRTWNISPEDKVGIISLRNRNLSPSGNYNFIFNMNESQEYWSDKLHNLNNPNAVQFTRYLIGVRGTSSLGGSLLHISLYDYLKIRPEIDYSCFATAHYKNVSDLSGGMDSFVYHITTDVGTIDTITTFEPIVEFKYNGDYPYKVFGYSNRGQGYSELFRDTLHIRIPPKPIARFRALDTVVCAYQPVGFHNTSSASSVHPTKEQKWVYTFGDGSTRTLTQWKDSVQHTYTQPGVYTVTLFYSNGYCDSTLTLNQHVRVVDAPEPGFVIAEMQGCAPFDIHITDTITVNTVKKEYSFDNGLTWNEVPVNQPDIDHSYTESGVYWVTQRLHGYTGCITQVDSIQVFVSKGFTASDTSHIFVATWQDVLPKQENWVSIQWNCMDETAHSYELKRNNQTMATFTDCNGIGSFEDKEANANPNLRYQIVAADSCGTFTQVGSIGQPIFLQGEIKGQNEWAVIEFSPYADIQHQSGEFAYDIQTFSEGNWKTIHQPNAAGLFEDKPLISNDVNALEKCYRIVGQNQAQISISNVLCLPYLPSVILPSAFSPNGDALNEIYRPLTLGIVSYQMEIYNRWGQLIYSGDESQIGWDGNNAPQGVYVVKIQGIDNQHYFHSYVGSVTLVR
jgi:gliding motility-associated-like protein